MSIFVFIIALSIGCAHKRYDREAQSVSGTMMLDQKIGQMLMVAVPGSGLNREADRILRNYQPGGVILFGYNLTSLQNSVRFINDMQKASLEYSGIPLFISIDQEGGRVVRFTSGVTQFPGAMAAGVSGDTGLAYQWGRILGLQLRVIGVNMNLAPVLDVNNNPHNPVINTRSFGSDPRLVADMGAAYIRGLQESRCVAAGKHFPGHGDTDMDSHITLPVIRYDMKRLGRVELVPFIEAVGAGVESIMTAHIAYPEILGGNDPATVSGFFLTDVLRKEMRFRGLVVTDDMEMHAISQRQDMGEAAVRSIMAGADIILISSYGGNIPVIFNAIKKAVGEKRIPTERIDEAVGRILEVKIRYGIMTIEKGMGRFTLTDKEKGILDGAERVNEALSRKGILGFGRQELIDPGDGAIRIFMTRNRILREEISRNADAVIISGFGDLTRFAPAQGRNVILYLHLAQPDPGSLEKAVRYCAHNGIDVVLVSSGNPFPLTVSGLVRTGILSFSDTDESIRQLGRCLSGAFRPGRGGSLNLGTEKKGR
ncbi:MAG: hypothetical protein A2176_10875 [Spirochaetes bacterium RBG_13_51_14]|nr:MAG: hypothetical protein A2176_10875 [Spirochaetes bacterium RBG_13_51_14]